jgi:hypothetical protein
MWKCKTRMSIGSKLYILLHSYGNLCYWLHIYFLALLLSTHNQHQNMCLCIGDELHYPSTMNYTLPTPKNICLCISSQSHHSPTTNTHNQHQNMCLCKGNELHHPPIMNYTLSTPKQSKPKSLSKSKISITTLYSNHDSLQREGCFSRSQTPFYILIKRKQVKKLPKTYPPHGSPCDCTINHKKQYHMVPHVIPQLITRNNITWCT